MSTPPPSPRIRKLIQELATLVVDTEDLWVQTIDATAVSGRSVQGIADDPVLRSASRRHTASSIRHWAASNISRPGGPVKPYVSEDTRTFARDLMRRGLDDSGLTSFRAGQNAALQLLVDLVFDLTQDPVETRELLNVCISSITAFVDDAIGSLMQQIEAERSDLTGGQQAERRAVVALIVDGAPITEHQAGQRLGYRIDADHTAVVIWAQETSPDVRDLERTAERLAAASGARRPLTVLAGASTLWVWLPGAETPSIPQLQELLAPHPHLRIAAGSTATGMVGFRRSHLEALTTQRMLARTALERRSATFAEVQLASLLAHDVDSARGFVQSTLGDLASARVELRETLRAYGREQCNASRAAQTLFVHRNTFLRRLDQAQALLPRPFVQHVLDVGVALELDYWLGSQTTVG